MTPPPPLPPPSPLPPPAFPPWRVKLDPLLAAQDTNALYQAFRQRRTGEKRRVFKSSFRTVAWNAAWLGCAGLIIIGKNDYSLFAMYALLIVGGLYRRFSSPKECALPFWLMEVFEEKSIRRRPAVDLWMTGASGKDVFEALYLEGAEKSGYLPWLFASLLLLGGAWGSWEFGDPVSLPGALAAASFAFVSWQILHFCWTTGGGGYACNEINKRFVNPGYASFPTRILKRTAAFLAIIVSYAILGAILIFGLIWSIEYFSSASSGRSDEASFVSRHRFELFLIGSMTLLGFTLHFSRGWFRRRNSRNVAKAFARADFAYNHRMAVEVVGDLDGERWAREVYESTTRSASSSASDSMEPLIARNGAAALSASASSPESANSSSTGTAS